MVRTKTKKLHGVSIWTSKVLNIVRVAQNGFECQTMCLVCMKIWPIIEQNLIKLVNGGFWIRVVVEKKKSKGN